MAYSKRYAGGFVDLPTQTSACDSTFFNAVEAALLKLFDTDPTVDGQVQSWIAASTKFGPALLLNKNIDPAAAIVKSKLDFSGANGIVNADVAGAAAIARSKLNFGSGLVDADIAAAAAIVASKIAGYPADATKMLLGNGTWGPGAYTAYVPTWTASGTAPAIGNATVIGQYVQVGKLVHAYGSIVFGSTSTFGTGVYSLALPVPASVNAIGGGNNSCGSGYGSHSVSGMFQPTYFIRGGGTTMGIFYATTYLGAAAQAGQLAPWTWANADLINWDILYEAA